MATISSSSAPDVARVRDAPLELRPALVILAAIAVTGGTLLVVFDLGPPLAFNDDWMYAWAARRLATGHLALFPASSALALTQVGWATLVTLGHTDQRLLRLSVIPFVALLAAATFQVSRRLGTGHFWSGVSALVVTASPLFLASATSFMSDVPYTALVMAAVWNGLRWLQDGRGRTWTVLFVVAAAAQRQIGVFMVPALTLAMWLAWRSQPPRPARWVPVAGLWAAAVAAVLVPGALGLTPAAASTRLSHFVASPIASVIDLLVLPGEIGLVLIPFAAALLTVSYVKPSRDHRGPALIVLAGAVLLILITHAGLPISGDSFAPAGLMDVQLPDAQTKQLLYPWPLYDTVMLLAIGSFAVFAVWRWGAWRATGTAGVALVAVAASQLAPWFFAQHFAYDRYYFPVAAPLVPVAAWAADRSLRPNLAQAWAVGALALGLAVYAVGEQDYQAWQQARDATARLAYQSTSPEYVSAGYEANAVYWELPYYDRTGVDLSGWTDSSSWDFAILGPRRPRALLVFAAADDPRPGTTYESASRGKVVVQLTAEAGP